MMNSHQPKNKNALLSCALTGGFDDLSSGIVLTAAEKPVFTIGNAPVLSDTDNFSEVSLDRDGNSSEIGPSDLQTDAANSFYTSPLAELDSYNNLQSLHDFNHQQPPPTLDINSGSNNNDQQQQQQQSFDGNFNPISAAFGSAASTVFSTFSSIIKGSSSQSKFEEHQQQQQDQQVPVNSIDSFSISYQDPSSNGYNLPPDTSAPPPPSFFSPDDKLLFQKPAVDMPSNTFRLGGNKKKTYAHIPGLSSSATANVQPVPQNFNLTPVMPPLPPQPITQVDSMANFPPPVQPAPQNLYENVEHKSHQPVSNKFSFSSLLEKIPVTKTLFGGAPEQNTSEFYPQNNAATNNSANFNQTPQIFESANYFMPHAQLSEQQQQQSSMIQAHNSGNGFFNAQANLTVNAPPPPSSLFATNNDLVSVQNPAVAPMPSSENNNNNFATVNFFNPQQFNTQPFAKVQQPLPAAAASVAVAPFGNDVMRGIESIGKHETASSQTQSIANSLMTPPLPPPSQLFSTAAASTPLAPQQNEMQPQQTIQFAPHNYSTPPPQPPPSSSHPPLAGVVNSDFPQNIDVNAPPPIFFNPNEASDMFKPRLSIDGGKPKNPYSNNRARGVGLYRARTSSTSESSSANQQTMMPMAPAQQPSQQQFFTPASLDATDVAQNTQSRPSSVAPIDIQQSATAVPSALASISSAPLSVVEPNQDVSFAFEAVPTQLSSSSQPPAMQKSDLNVPEHEEKESAIPFGEQEQRQQQQQLNQPAIMSSVSNFFARDTPGGTNEQKSALNFFQDQPEALPQPVVSGQNQQAFDSNFSATQNDSFNAINFFNMAQAPACESPQSHQQQQQCIAKEEEFNSPITSSTIQGNDSTINDITDKMESLSACSRSTLSLFATSELDSTMGQKHLSSAPVESLIPKYLEQQPPMGESLKPPVNENSTQKYRPIYCHWFYQNLHWHPFSMSDSLAIDQAIHNGEEVVSTSGGRYEVKIKDRKRSSIYWSSGSNAVRKCSWFYIDALNGKRNIIPYDESLAEFFEKEYEKALTHETWNHRINLPDSNEYIIMKDSSSIEHHKMGQTLIVKRGIDEFDIDDGEEGTPDHLILCVSSFGDKTDDNAADEIRSKCLETIQQYYSEAFDCGQIKRVEVLPIALNSIDVLKMCEINNAIADSSTFKVDAAREIGGHIMSAMLYSNEKFYQKIMNHLAFSLNEIVSKFKQRNTNFGGGISLMSSSFEALFLFDLLANGGESSDGGGGVSKFWKTTFDVSKFFACGMPTSLLMIRHGDKLRHGFSLSGCERLFNLIHPNDSIGQRIEPFIIPEYSTLPPELIDNLSCTERIDFTLPVDTSSGGGEQYIAASSYFSSDAVVKRILNEIYGANCMDSGDL